MEPDPESCLGCGRPLRTAGGALDLLPTDLKAAANGFVTAYQAVRRIEGWACTAGVEDPEAGNQRLWRPRLQAARRAAALLEGPLSGEPPLVADIGAGGGWLARLLPSAEVVALDLAEPAIEAATVRARGDMRRLPLADASLDAAFYCAALHYAPLEEAIREAARVLRRGGQLISVESPIYPDPGSAALAAERSSQYFGKLGSPVLASSYHPIEIGHLGRALASAGFRVDRLDRPRRRYGRWQMMKAARAFPTLVASRL